MKHRAVMYDDTGRASLWASVEPNGGVCLARGTLGRAGQRDHTQKRSHASEVSTQEIRWRVSLSFSLVRFHSLGSWWPCIPFCLEEAGRTPADSCCHYRLGSPCPRLASLHTWLNLTEGVLRKFTQLEVIRHHSSSCSHPDHKLYF